MEKELPVRPYLDSQVRVHQDLELEIFLALICDLQRGRQRIIGKSDAVDQPKFIWPSFPELLAQHTM